MEEKHTMCRLCGAVCPILVHLENGRIVSAERKTDLPPGKAYPCAKLAAAQEIIYSPQRVKTPLIKREFAGNIYWEEISWDQALDTVVTQLNFFKEKYGAESVCWMRGQAPDWGATWDYAQRFMDVFGSPNVIGTGYSCYAPRQMAHVYTYGAMTSPDYRNSKCILVWGKNDQDTNPAAFERILQAKEQGAKLLVVDPIKTELAQMADIWLQIKPGCDGLLAMSMIHVIISEGLYDSDYIKEWVLGFDRLREEAEKVGPEMIGEIIWLDPKKIREAARLYARTKPACLIDGNGLDMHVNVVQNTRAVCLLRALAGNLDTKGGDLFSQPIQIKNIRLKERLPENLKPITFQYPLFSDCGKLSGKQALPPLLDAILEGKPYPIKALVVQGANPVVTMANSSKVLHALSKLNFIVAIDLFQTRTAKLAHLILPASTSFEKTQLNTASTRNNRVILQNQVVDWVENSWPDWKIIFELAKKMGYEEEFPWPTVEEAIDDQLKPSGITVKMLRNNPNGVIVGEARYEKYKLEGFDTKSGKIEIYPEVFEEYGYQPLPRFTDGDENLLSFYSNRDDYPFIGISGAKSNHYVHSQLRNIPFLRQCEPEPFVDIHPTDALKQGIKNGDDVRIQTPKGSIKMKSRISDIVTPGVVRIPWGWGETNPQQNINVLTDDEVRSPATSTPPMRDFMCNVVKEVEPS